MSNKKLILLVVSLLTTTIAFIIGFFIIENQFFDQVLFQKSPLHGYVKNKHNLDYISPFHYTRAKDLISLRRYSSSMQKDSDATFTIVIIGDSFTYGMGIRNNQRFLTKLEKKLDKIKPTKIYSLALPGDNFLDYYINYKAAENYIQPDLYIITMVENDFVINSHWKYPDYERNQKIFSKICGKNKHIEKYSNDMPSWYEFVNQVSYPSSINETNICYVKTALSKFDQNKTLYVTMTPFDLASWDNDDDSNNFNTIEATANIGKIMSSYIELITNAHGSVLPMNPFLEAKLTAEEVFVSEKEGHHSYITNDFITEKLFDEIKSNSKWKFLPPTDNSQ